MQGKVVLIMGSARKDGDTLQLVRSLERRCAWAVVDLNDYQIGYYDYEHRNKDDDYLPLMRRIISDFDVFVFVTPVYWYSMSGIMKVFFDRLSDLLTIEKELGRKLRGKKISVQTCSNGNNLGDAFFLAFRQTANYLGMDCISTRHFVSGNYDEKALASFVEELQAEV